MTEIIMSLKPQYVELILSGQKTVELRSRKLNVERGTLLWIYSTLPKGCVEALATIEYIEYNSPKEIWQTHYNELSISYEDFVRYVNGNEFVSAIKLSGVRRLNTPIPLQFIKSCVDSFHPPQFFSRVTSGMALSDLLHAGPREAALDIAPTQV